MERCRLRLMFEWGGGSLWCGNQAARDRFAVGPVEDQLTLSDALRAELDLLSEWHERSLNRDDPGGPGFWDGAETARFDAAAEALCRALAAELGAAYQVDYEPL